MYVNGDDAGFKRVMSHFEYLPKYSAPVKRMTRQLVGREKEMRSVAAAMERAELSNVILLAAAGSGKTALVQGLMEKDRSRVFLEIDLSRMIRSRSNHGENTRSHQTSSMRLNMSQRICMPSGDIPTS
jgi:hypothetical protein